MNAGIQVTFWQFTAQLSEWLEQRVIEAYMAEVFSFYAAGGTVAQTAQAVAEIERRPDLGNGGTCGPVEMGNGGSPIEP